MACQRGGQASRTRKKQHKWEKFKREYLKGDWQIENDWKWNSFILEDKESEREHFW